MVESSRAHIKALGLTLLVAGALWISAFQVFREVPPAGGCRFDFGESVAYPVSDAGCDYQNALAILSGDGWVN